MAGGLQKSKWRGRVLRYAPLFLCIGVIFLLSTRQGGMSNTSLFVRPLLLFFFPGATEESLLIYHSYIRKLAHFVEYSALAFFALRAFASSSNKFLHNYSYFVSFLLVFLIAALDEFNQSFSPARTGSFRDVLLDVFGGLTMLTFLYFWNSSRRREAA